MAGKARVHELAKELGVTSKEVLARLSEQGEFVKSASSTVEAPVARRLREALGGPKPRQSRRQRRGQDCARRGAEARRRRPRPDRRSCRDRGAQANGPEARAARPGCGTHAAPRTGARRRRGGTSRG